MEKIKLFWSWLKTLPLWVRIIVYILISVLSLILSSFPILSCGITQTTVNNVQSDSSKIEMVVNPSQSTSTSITEPNLNLNSNGTN